MIKCVLLYIWKIRHFKEFEIKTSLNDKIFFNLMNYSSVTLFQEKIAASCSTVHGVWVVCMVGLFEEIVAYAVHFR